MGIGTLIRASEDLPAVEVSSGQVSDCAHLLELRTQSGPIYVCPSWWQRMRLRWAFRHFRVLPPQVLSRSDQELVERLASSAVVHPAEPIEPEQVFGVVENIHVQSAPLSIRGERKTFPNQLQPLRPAPVPVADPAPRLRAPSFPEETIDAPSIVHQAPVLSRERNRRTRFTRDSRFEQWGALGVLAVVCAAVIVLHFSDPGLLRMLSTPLPTPVAQSAPVAPALSAAPAVTKVKLGPLPELTAVSPTAYVTGRRLKPVTALPEVSVPGEPLAARTVATSTASSSAPSPAASAAIAEKAAPQPSAPQLSARGPFVAKSNAPSSGNEIANVIPAASPERRFVSELPQGHFAEPVVTDPNLVGELRLRAVIGADGSVKDVTVLSGNPKLADAATRAVKRWRYQALDHPGEAETLIRMRFFGQDGVSIASIAK